MTGERTQREYVRVQPTGTAPRPEAVTRQLTRLHALTAEREPDGRFAALKSPTSEPVRLEVLLVAPGGPEPRLDYYIGCAPTEQLPAVERHLSGLFPDEYELTRTTLALEEVATTPTEAVAFTGVAERRRDWQMRLAEYEEFVAADADDPVDDPPPLATVAAALAESPTPAVYQALAEPLPDYTVDANVRRKDLREGRERDVGERVHRHAARGADRHGLPGQPTPVLRIR